MLPYLRPTLSLARLASRSLFSPALHSTTSSAASSPIPIRLMMSETEVKLAQAEGSFTSKKNPRDGSTPPSFPGNLLTAYTNLNFDPPSRRQPLRPPSSRLSTISS